MQTGEQTKTAAPSVSLFIKMVISAWDTQNTRLDKLLDTLTEQDWLRETAPGRNTGIYLLGHLTAVNDGLFTLLGFGERLYAGLDPVFLASPDKAGLDMPTVEELKTYWRKVNNELSRHMQEMDDNAWFTRHSAVSQADFEKEPHRNKLNILINRTNHQSYHLGQLAYLVRK